MKIEVVRTEIVIFTESLPTIMVISNLLGYNKSFCMYVKKGFLSSFILCKWRVVREKREASEPEKNPERSKRINNKKSLIVIS